jgi:hypothetical protein
MPEPGSYLLTNVGFSHDEKPLLLFQTSEQFIDVHPLSETFSLSFDMSQRFCIGWRDITTGERAICPDSQQIDAKYEQCSACQKRTGFNPAFYHATTVSPQQEARNSEPHILYLAHFGTGVIKVGISHAKRGRSRLLEQGARTAIVLDELSTAHIARYYEKQIAALAGISETVQSRRKNDLLTTGYDEDIAQRELDAVRVKIETALGVQFSHAKSMSLDSIYFPNEQIDVTMAHISPKQHLISGTCIGQLGSFLFCRQSDTVIYLPLKKHVGYKATITDTVIPIATPPRQASLF